ASSGNGHAAEAAAASGGDFSFGSLLEERQPAPAPPEPEPEAAPEPQFPGDEPTRVEPVSAALIDKLRERDEEAAPAAEAAPQQQGWGALVGEDERTVESAPPAMPEPAPPPEAPVTMQDFSMPAMEEHDPDEAHWRETFDKFKQLKSQLGEPSDRISFE